MKAFKGCVNRDCKAYTKKVHYKDDYNYCPYCGDDLEYVCADCWKVLEHNDKKYCTACEVKREQIRQQKFDKAKAVGVAVVGAGKVVWDHKDKVADVTKAAVKVIKK